ncbi:MAG: hypothetical protein V7K88_04640 [Nostoc sp.]|uniref:hypothetical protein n=1 Tax=Nostoc sp. TaxID=1180 RepID=UPI002FFAFD45
MQHLAIASFSMIFLTFQTSSKLDFIHFLATQKLTLKPLWDGSFSFSISPKISDIEKVFAKKLGSLPDQENQVLNFG